MANARSRNIKKNPVLACKTLSIALSCFLVVTGCQSTAKDVATEAAAPSWVSQPPKPSGDLLYGVGSAPVWADEALAKQAAEEHARSELAKQIRVFVQAETRVHQQASTAGMSYKFNEQLSNRVPEMELPGVTVESHYIATHEKTAYALMSFNKTMAIKDLQRLIEGVDQQVIQMPLNSDAAKPMVIRQALNVKRLMLKRNRYNNQLENLSHPRVTIPAAAHQQAIVADNELDSILFAVEGVESNADLDRLLTKSLNDNGLRVAPAEQADLILNYSVQWQHIERDKTFFEIATLNVNIAHQGKIRTSFVQKAKGVSGDSGLAKSKALEQLQDRFTSMLSKQLLDSFLN